MWCVRLQGNQRVCRDGCVCYYRLDYVHPPVQPRRFPRVESAEQWGVRSTYQTWLLQTPEETLRLTHTHNVTDHADAELWLLWVQSSCLQYGENQPLTKVPSSSGGACWGTQFHVIVCSCFPNTCRFFKLWNALEWLPSAPLVTVRVFNSSNNIRLNFNDLCGEIGLQQQQRIKWHQNHKMEVWWTQNDKKKKKKKLNGFKELLCWQPTLQAYYLSHSDASYWDKFPNGMDMHTSIIHRFIQLISCSFRKHCKCQTHSNNWYISVIVNKHEQMSGPGHFFHNAH